MIAAIPVESASENAAISMRFARSGFFCILNRATGDMQFVENEFASSKQGAGKGVFNWLTGELGVTQFMGHELGMKLQHLATEKKVQLIILPTNLTALSGLFGLMKLQRISYL